MFRDSNGMEVGIGFDRLFLLLNREVADLTQMTDPEYRIITLVPFPYLLVFVQLPYTSKVEQRGVSAKANPLNTNDLGRFNRQELCRLFGGMDEVDLGNFGQCWPKLGW